MCRLSSRLAFCAGIALISAALVDAGCDDSTSATPASASEPDANGPKVPVEASAIDNFVPVPDEPRPDGCAPFVPNPVQDFTPEWKAPSALHQSKCTVAEIDDIVRCNFDPDADAATCDAVLKDAGSKDCNNCLFTASTGKYLGPVVITGTIGTLNIAGCIAALDGDISGTGCGARFAASDQCARESCDRVTAIIRLGRLFCGAGDAGAALDGATDG